VIASLSRRPDAQHGHRSGVQSRPGRAGAAALRPPFARSL